MAQPPKVLPWRNVGQLEEPKHTYNNVISHSLSWSTEQHFVDNFQNLNRPGN